MIIACALWGNWPAKGYSGKLTGSGRGWEYVAKLKRAVERNLSIPHRFICFTDDVENAPDDIEAIPLRPMTWKRASPKAYVYTAPFSGAPIEEGERVIMFDLDNIIIGSIDDMAAYVGNFCVRGTFPSSLKKIGRSDGDMIAFKAGSDECKKVYDMVKAEQDTDCAMTEGDERLIISKALPNVDIWQDIIPGQIVSYKEEVRKNPRILNNARVVSMHGKPAPHELEEAEWIRGNWV